MKTIYKCRVNGYLGQALRGRLVCDKTKTSDSSICMAHGNVKCEHKCKQRVNKT